MSAVCLVASTARLIRISAFNTQGLVAIFVESDLTTGGAIVLGACFTMVDSATAFTELLRAIITLADDVVAKVGLTGIALVGARANEADVFAATLKEVDLGAKDAE